MVILVKNAPDHRPSPGGRVVLQVVVRWRLVRQRIITLTLAVVSVVSRRTQIDRIGSSLAGPCPPARFRPPSFLHRVANVYYGQRGRTRIGWDRRRHVKRGLFLGRWRRLLVSGTVEELLNGQRSAFTQTNVNSTQLGAENILDTVFLCTGETKRRRRVWGAD